MSAVEDFTNWLQHRLDVGEGLSGALDERMIAAETRIRVLEDASKEQRREVRARLDDIGAVTLRTEGRLLDAEAELRATATRLLEEEVTAARGYNALSEMQSKLSADMDAIREDYSKRFEVVVSAINSIINDRTAGLQGEMLQQVLQGLEQRVSKLEEKGT